MGNGRQLNARRTLVLIVFGCLAGAVVVGAAALGSSSLNGEANDLAYHSVPAARALQATSAAADASHTSFAEAIASHDPAQKAVAINAAQRDAGQEDAAWAAYLRVAGTSVQERRLQREYVVSSKQSRDLGAALVASSPLDAGYAGQLTAQDDASTRARGFLNRLQRNFADIGVTGGSRAVVADLANARRGVLIAAAAALLLFLGFGAVTMRRVLRDEDREAVDARARAVEARRADIETRLQRALELESTEEGTYDLIRQALAAVTANRAVELLVADSRHAHFHQVVSTADDDLQACRVAAPGECPAARSGQTQVFDTSAHLDTCPYLRDNPEPVWATCVPVSIAGRTTGVVHAQGRADSPPDGDLTAELELVARKVGDRIGVLRVLGRSETQAQVDPLTRLPNRRTLETRARELLERDVPFVVAFADLDHFKDLNDLHGHDIGDRALRLFARVLRDSIRPRDILARYGGEEFVVVLPDCTVDDARVVAERIRSELGTKLTDSTVPPFTVSVGLAAADPGEALSTVINRADAALLQAKQLGRDRVVSSGQAFPLETPTPTSAGSSDDPRQLSAEVRPIANVR